MSDAGCGFVQETTVFRTKADCESDVSVECMRLLSVVIVYEFATVCQCLSHSVQ